MTKARTNAKKLADKRRRSLSSRQMQQQWQAQQQTEPAKPQEDPRCVVLSARCRVLGRPDTKHHRAAMTEQMAGDPAGQVIILAEPNADNRRKLWDAFVKLDTAHAAYHGRIIGQRRFPKTAKIEMLPERFETDADAPMDYRSQEDREQAAINAWRAQMALMHRLPVHDRMSLHDGLWLRGDFVTGGKITAMGQALVARHGRFLGAASRSAGMKQTITILGAPIASNSEAHSHSVSLPAMPWINGTTIDRDPRHETAPRRDIITPRERVTPDQFIALLQRECVKARKEGMA